jgi:hypothetical protein
VKGGSEGGNVPGPALDYQPEGALAPPVAEDPPLSLPPDEDDFSDEAFSLDSPAEVPPEASLSPDELSLDSPPSSLLEVEPVPVVEVVAVAVVDVEVVSVASFSADVSFGGVISGVLLGVTSDTLVPPHALTPSEARSIRALAASAIRRERCGGRLTRRAGPSAGCRLSSR